MSYCKLKNKVVRKNSFQHRLIVMMMRNNENCSDIAKVCGINRKAVYYWFEPLSDIKLSYVMKIANHYHVSIDWLVGLKKYTPEMMTRYEVKEEVANEIGRSD